MCDENMPEEDGLYGLAATDPEYAAFLSAFMRDEVRKEEGANHPDLDGRTRAMAVLAALIGCQGLDAYARELDEALDAGVTPVEAKEIVYQATAYLGVGRVLPFVERTNRILTERGVALPLAGQSTTSPDTRVRAGEDAQVAIFGEHMRGFARSGPEQTRHINRWLAGNCFGDYYTRDGLDHRRREMITLCFLAAQGGCEPQLTSHAMGNMRVGNDRAFLTAVVSQCMPYLGYPRTLNALRCIGEADKALHA